MITLKGIHKSYGSKAVLKGIDLHLGAGQVYGIVGENGSGKTTLFNGLAGLSTFDSGDISYADSEDTKRIGFLETNPIFMSRITGWEYLKLLCIARNIKEDDFEEQNIFELPLQQYAENYSTGMKKKLALMGILLQRNNLFILDEPFNGVDIQSNILIAEIIAKLKAAGKTVVISSHIFSTLSDNCDKIFLLQDGVIQKSVTESQFKELEDQMKERIIETKLDKLKFS